MLQADSAHVIGEREQKIVMIVVVRTVKFVGLLHQGSVRLQLLGLRFQQFRAIRENVQMNRRGTARIQVQRV